MYKIIKRDPITRETFDVTINSNEQLITHLKATFENTNFEIVAIIKLN